MFKMAERVWRAENATNLSGLVVMLLKSRPFCKIAAMHP
jgi:hypothetical protein